MPKLLNFSPCENIIVANDNTISLITILEKVQIHLPVSEDHKLPENAQIPFKWFVFTSWLKQPGDDGKTFEQLIDITLPGEKSLRSSIVNFQLSEMRHRTVVQLPGMPITPKGIALIKLLLREQGQQDWNTIADYPLLIERPVDEAQNAK
jgi:hypothetical protein